MLTLSNMCAFFFVYPVFCPYFCNNYKKKIFCLKGGSMGYQGGNLPVSIQSLHLLFLHTRHSVEYEHNTLWDIQIKDSIIKPLCWVIEFNKIIFV